ncbi:hypothetical protein [Brucella pituitosa]|uniref:hypothetical protein n=1 Tax=Brucella pituitosa TaxID=571256 RepID=UPI003F4AB87E
MTRARLSKDGLFMAKPGRQIEEGESALAFSPNGAQQPIYDKGVVPFQAFNQGGARPTAYTRAAIYFPTPFAQPPLCYCMGILAGNEAGAREPAFTMWLGVDGNTIFREPIFWWQSFTNALFIYSRWTLATMPSASYVVTYNEAS